MREKAVRRGGRHRGAHIVDVGHAEIHDLPESGGSDGNAFAFI